MEKKQRRISHAGARQKGLSFERWVANELKHIFPEARRHLEFQDDKIYGIDLVNTGPFGIQCKKLKNYVSINTIHEVKTDEFYSHPILVTAGDRQEAMAVLKFETLRLLLESFERLRLFEGEKQNG